MNIESYEYLYPPDLFQLLVDTIPLLCRTKADVLAFFAGAGVSDTDLLDLKMRVRANRDGIKKFEIVRTILTRLNEKGVSGLGVRRAVLRRVTDWDDFSTCWENDRRDAELQVGQIQKLVGRKDAITRIALAEEEQRRLRAEEAHKKLEEVRRHKEELTAIKADLFSLYGQANPQQRGKALESVLNRLFKANDLLVREAFTLAGPHGEGSSNKLMVLWSLMGTSISWR